MKSVNVGEVEIVALTDVEGPFFWLDRIFPGVRPEDWEPYLARYPWAFAERRVLHGRVGAYLLRSRRCTVLVDTGVGPAAFGRSGRLLDNIEENGVCPEDVDIVFLTHLHGDHLGWSLNEESEPVFPEARYVTQGAEWEVSLPYAGRVLEPLQRLGVLDLLDGEEPVTEEITAIPTPGHSPGHASLLVSSGGGQALVVGDVVVHPAQVTEPTWNVHFDVDKEQAAHTREMLLGWVESDGLLVAAGHVPGAGFGHVVRGGNGRRCWRALGEEEVAPAIRTEVEGIRGRRTE